MFVIKRCGNTESVNFDKIDRRIKLMCKDPVLLENVNHSELAQSVIRGLHNNIETKEIDEYTANLAASMTTVHSEYGILAGRIIINNCHKNTLGSFYDKMKACYFRKDKSGTIHPLVYPDFYKFVKKHHKRLEKFIDYDRDYNIDFFGFRTLEKGYLLRVNDEIIERPQDLFMRVATFIHYKQNPTDTTFDSIKGTYDMLSNKFYTHATPTLFNAGTIKPSLLSCFLLGTEDSREGILSTLDDATQISKWSGGIGIHVSNWRAEGSLIRGTNGQSNGIVPFLKMFNAGARAFNQGGKRMGSFAIYLEPHHPEVLSFLELRRNRGDENLRCRDLFLALWVSDLFMKRVESDEMWSTFCPDQCPGLSDAYGDEYERLYLEYESVHKYHNQVKARDIWKMIFESQKETGLPYLCYKDHVNKMSMQHNLGTVKSSNLCAEIMEYSSSSEYACCTLASLCLPQFVVDTYTSEELNLPDNERRSLDHEYPVNPVFNYKKLAEAASELVVNLNNIIDRNWYPTVETLRSNMKHRPIAIGVQGFADLLYKFRYSFESPEAKILNKRIFECIYYGCLSKSSELCRHIYKNIRQEIETEGKYTETLYTKAHMKQYPVLKQENVRIQHEDINNVPTTIGAYSSYEGSHISKGTFHWELYGLQESDLSGMFDWDTLRTHIQMYGVRNSLCVALMPTASTSQIMGNAESFEPYKSNLFKRKTLAGEFILVNKYLMRDLIKLDLWNDTMKNYLMYNNGSIQSIDGIPDTIKDLYKTIWEIKQKSYIELAVDRQPFIDQSQSMNLYVENLTMKTFNSMHFFSWKNKLKTGCYYMRTRPAAQAQKFTVDVDIEKALKLQSAAELLDEEEEICLMCGS
jgi:ribonucleoside-diphosphate reductase alpha subunit